MSAVLASQPQNPLNVSAAEWALRVQLAGAYRERGMAAYAELQEREFAAEARGYTATRHQREVGTGYFDAVAQIISGGAASTLALERSTEKEQF